MKLNIPRHYITIMRNYAIFDDSIGHLQWRKEKHKQIDIYRPGTIIYVCAFYLTYDSLIPLKGGLSKDMRGGII